jgi:hypothetical protein
MRHLHGEVGDVAGLRHAFQPEQRAIEVVRHGGRFGERPQGVLLHHPDIGVDGMQQHLGVVDHAAVHAGHGQRHPDQQAQPQPGQQIAFQVVDDVAPREVNHG